MDRGHEFDDTELSRYDDLLDSEQNHSNLSRYSSEERPLRESIYGGSDFDRDEYEQHYSDYDEDRGHSPLEYSEEDPSQFPYDELDQSSEHNIMEKHDGFRGSNKYQRDTRIPYKKRDPIELVILSDAANPFITNEEAKLVTDKILQDIDDIDDNVTQPRFRVVSKEGRMLRILCADSSTRRWLYGRVENWEPLWEGENAKLYIEQAPEVVRACIRIQICIPEIEGVKTPPFVYITRIWKHNRKYKTRSWKVVTHFMEKVTDSTGNLFVGVRLCVDIPEFDYLKLKQDDMILVYFEKLLTVELDSDEQDLIDIIHQVKNDKIGKVCIG